MKRTGFKPKFMPRPVKRMDDYTQKPRCVAVAASDASARMVVSRPKPEKARPGKRAPTADERAWMDAITTIGCIACLVSGYHGTPGAVHHILRGGRRIGHLHSICLCDPGHHQNGNARGMVSRHPHKARFEAIYGTEEELLELSRTLVNGTIDAHHHEVNDAVLES